MALSLAVSAATLLGGVAATYCYDRRTPLAWRIPIGGCVGLAALGLIGFVLATRFGLTKPVVALAGLLTGTPAALLLVRAYRQALLLDLAAAVRSVPLSLATARIQHLLPLLLYAAGAALLWRVADRTMFMAADGVYTGVSHNIGDLPFHLTVINRFVYGGNFPPEHPSFAGAGFTYPFLTDFLAGMFVVAGAPIREVIVCSTFLLCAALAALLYRWTLELTGSQAAAWLAPVLALLSGGLGWWTFVIEAWERHGSVWMLLSHLPHDYTITRDNEYRWGNLVTSLLVTQRGLLLGLPLAIVVFRLWWDTWSGTGDDVRTGRSRMVAAGVIAGMLPLIHAHSFAVVLGVGFCLAIQATNRWAWLPFFAWSLALGLPQVWWVTRASGMDSEAFLAWSLGWDHGNQNVVTFWIKNTGVFIPLLIAAFLWPSAPRQLRLFCLPFMLCFTIPNLVRLAPWIWDNIKVLVYWFIASVPLVAFVLGELMRRRNWLRALSAALLIALTFAGALDLWRVASGAFESRIYDNEGIDFAKAVAGLTSPSALILHAPIPNHPVALSGRRSLMGYPGHVWSHGLDPGPREADIKRIYAGGAAASSLLARYGIDYVVIGPDERFQMMADEAFFERYRRVADTGGYRLYRIREDQHP